MDVPGPPAAPAAGAAAESPPGRRARVTEKSHECTETHLEVFNALEIVCPGVPGEVTCTSGALAPAFVIEHALCVSNMHLIAVTCNSAVQHACSAWNMHFRPSAYQ